MKPTYALVRLGKLLLSAVNDKLVSCFLVHVALNPIQRRKEVELELLKWGHLLGITGFPVLSPVAHAGLVAIFGSTR